MTIATNLKELYEIDDSLWLEETVKLLKLRQFNELDLDNLIGELEDLGSEKRNAVESLLQQIIRHLLLYQYWTMEKERNFYHWQAEIYEFRDQLNARLTTNLKNHLVKERLKIYQRALGYVQRKTGFKVNFPSECFYTLEQLLDINYLPE